jgi:hypothetical protein
MNQPHNLLIIREKSSINQKLPKMQFHQHPTLVTILLSLSLLHLRITDALYFRLTPLIASLTTIPTSDPPTYGDATRPSPASPSERYYDVTFTVSNPDAVWEQGGRGEVYCDVYWYVACFIEPSHLLPCEIVLHPGHVVTLLELTVLAFLLLTSGKPPPLHQAAGNPAPALLPPPHHQAIQIP